MNRITATFAATMIVVGGVIALAVSGGTAPAAADLGVHHPDCPGLVKDIVPGAATPIDGHVYVKAGPIHYDVGLQRAGYVAGPQGGHDVSHVDVCPREETTTTSTVPETTTTSTTTTSLPETTTTTSVETTTTTTEPDQTTTTSTTEPDSTTTTSTVVTTTTQPERTTTTTQPPPPPAPRVTLPKTK